MKKYLALFLALVVLFSLTACGGDGPGKNTNNDKQNLTAFHEKVSDSQKLLDTVADDIYSN